MMKYRCLKTYSFPLHLDGDDDDGGMLVDHDAGDKIHQKAIRLMERNPGWTYADALGWLRRTEPLLFEAYMTATTTPLRYSSDANPERDPSLELDLRAKALMESETCLTYSAAAARIIREHPMLGSRWARFTSAGQE